MTEQPRKQEGRRRLTAAVVTLEFEILSPEGKVSGRQVAQPPLMVYPADPFHDKVLEWLKAQGVVLEGP